VFYIIPGNKTFYVNKDNAEIFAGICKNWANIPWLIPVTVTDIIVSASEILGPIDEMTLLRKKTSKQCIKFYGILDEFGQPTKLKSVSTSKFFKNSKHI